MLRTHGALLAPGADTLYGAVVYGDSETVRHLIRHGTSPDAQNRQGHVPLHAAVTLAQPGMVRLLLELGADPEAVDGHAKRPIDYAWRAQDRSLLERAAVKSNLHGS